MKVHNSHRHEGHSWQSSGGPLKIVTVGDEAGITLIHQLMCLSAKNSPWPFSASEFKHVTSSVEAHYCGMRRDLHTSTGRNHPNVFVWIAIVFHDNPVCT